jgi:peptidoglycan/LPS O-acetylase OafA/YrhL
LAELPARDYFAPPNLRGEIKPLTGIRGVAAFLVMLYHYATTPTFPGFHLAELSKGYLCVDLFFVLSGFVLALRYGDRFKRTLSRSSYAAFLQARIARLYPAYVVITLLYYAKWVFNISGTNATPYRLQDFVANALFVQSWGFPVRPIIGDSWSVSVECFAYLAFPLLVFAALGRSRIAAPALTATAAGMLIFITCTGYGVNGPLDAYRNDDSLLPLVRCLAGFSSGMVAFRAARAPLCRRFLAAPATPFLVLFLLAVALWADKTDLVSVLLLPPLVACLYFDACLGRALFGNRLIHHLGEISYSLYLLHPLFLGVAGHFEDVAAARFGFAFPPAFIAFGIASTWLAAYLSYRFVELPGRLLLRPRGSVPPGLLAKEPLVPRHSDYDSLDVTG